MSKILIYSAIFAPSILIGLGIAIYLFQEKMIFHPEKLSDKYQFIFDGFFEERTYQTSDGNGLSALLFKAKNSKGVVFYHHGNTGSLNWWGKRAVDFTARGYDVLMYDYRGYGKSEGSIKNEKMLYEDATVIYKALLLEYEASKIIVYGVSLGSGIASYIALNGNPSQLILEAPYYNLYDVGK